MKDYSKYFKYPEVFITSIDCKKDKGQIIPTFKDKTNTYQLNEEMVQKLYERLTAQYLKVIANMTTVVNNKATFKLILSALLLASFGYLSYSYQQEILAICLAGGTAVSALGAAANELFVKPNHKEQIETYAAFLDHIDEFPKAIENDPNILDISKDGKRILDGERALQEEGLVPEAININFMDKASLDDLRIMSERLKIYNALELPVEFIGDKAKTKTKTK